MSSLSFLTDLSLGQRRQPEPARLVTGHRRLHQSVTAVIFNHYSTTVKHESNGNERRLIHMSSTFGRPSFAINEPPINQPSSITIINKHLIVGY